MRFGYDPQALPSGESAHELMQREERLEWLYDEVESFYLLKVAESWGIKPPPSKSECYIQYDKATLDRLHELGIEDTERPEILNTLGRAMIKNEIRDAKRASVKWWIEVLIPVLALAVALVSLFKDIVVEVLKNKF